MASSITDSPISIDDDASSQRSLLGKEQSASFDFVYENGRRYSSSKYSLIPTDETEEERLDLVHHLWGLLLRGELHRARLEGTGERGAEEQPFRVLDLGTGTGLWAMDFGDTYPHTQVTGMDLLEMEHDWVPPNVKFEVADYEEEWEFRHKFDYIHCRNLVGSVKDYAGLAERIYKNLVPGGVVEFQECHITGTYSEDATLHPASTIKQYSKYLAEAGEVLGQPMDVAPNLKSYLEGAGFIDVEVYEGRCPVGIWPRNKPQKELGSVAQEVLQTGVEAYGLAAFTRILGWDSERAKEFCEEVVREFNNRKVHKIYPIFVVTGRKKNETMMPRQAMNAGIVPIGNIGWNPTRNW
ncbi:S-adenosyl-L-methionine-dependent methyltransferase [Ascobolus immersus RN42]|uniref:S-adenosyl-L-methionine-dependent methyltransferase n=1 Tax=Ascobolus immersus RN42 TaxID=1160509 RepID=A0A3N4IXC9_ASCIM|nr:S-adenosyl-L-methionine-dependent methyltransferase [Ascobolus immersus RN42]